jgi:ribonuclease Z
VLYHESTFLDKNESLCAPTRHSTARQAATIAKKANVETLILGHYSTRYDSYHEFETEAKTVFDNVLLSQDGKSFEF